MSPDVGANVTWGEEKSGSAVEESGQVPMRLLDMLNSGLPSLLSFYRSLSLRSSSIAIVHVSESSFSVHKLAFNHDIFAQG